MGVSLLSKTHPQFMEYSNGSVMHTSTRACFLYFLYNPSMSLFNSKNFFIYLSPLFFTCIQQLTCTCSFVDYISHFISSFTYLLKYTSKKGLELIRLLTMELCSIKNKMCVAGSRNVLCNINAGSITSPSTVLLGT